MAKTARTAATARDIAIAELRKAAELDATVRSGGTGQLKRRDDQIVRMFVRTEFFTIQRTQAIIESTHYLGKFPRGGRPGGTRFRNLQHNLGTAVHAIIRILGPTRLRSIAHYKKIAETAKHLHELLTAEGLDAELIWALARCHADKEEMAVAADIFGPNNPTGFGGVISAKPIAGTVSLVNRLAERRRLALEATTDEPFNSAVILVEGKEVRTIARDADLTAFVAQLADAYSAFFDEEAGYSTDGADRRGGPFIRFAQAVGGAIGLAMTSNQTKKRLAPWKKARMRARRTHRQK